MKLTDIQKQEIVTKISHSKTLKNAPTSIALLQYLNEATLKGVDLKEDVVDIEFFGSKGNNDKRNPRVRVNVYNLRKKLTSYYENEGNEDNYVLVIDKGQYQVRFTKKESETSYLDKLSWKSITPYLFLVLVIFALVYTNKSLTKPKLWKSFLSQKATSNLFIGDHFGILGNTITEGTGWTRDFSINNVNEFYSLIDKHPELKDIIKPSNYSYTTRMGALAAQKIQQLYQLHNQKFDILYTTQTSISEIKEGNAIYAGPIKNNNQFIHFFNEANPYFKITNDTLKFTDHPQLKNTDYNLKLYAETQEYAIVSKYASIGNTEHFVFFSDHDIGVTATIEYFTNSDSLKSFNNKFLQDYNHFTAVFKVKGQDRTNTDLKLEMVVAF